MSGHGGAPGAMARPGPDGRFGEFGGRFVPESLVPACLELEAAFDEAWADPAFRRRLDDLLAHYGGRPTPLTECRRLSERMGERRMVAETGAGQHGVAAATAAALLGLACTVFMGEVDTERQALNVFRMEL